jgi:hypothetical protein
MSPKSRKGRVLQISGQMSVTNSSDFSWSQFGRHLLLPKGGREKSGIFFPCRDFFSLFLEKATIKTSFPAPVS